MNNFAMHIVTIVALLTTFAEAADSKTACETLAQCLTAVLSMSRKCDNISAEFPPTKQPPTDEAKSIIDMTANLTHLEHERVVLKIQCLQANLDKTVVATCNETKQQQCSRMVADYVALKQKPAEKTVGEITSMPQSERIKMRTELNSCMVEKSAKEAECNSLADCCSESKLCDLKIQGSQTGKEIADLSYLLTLERRSKTCPVVTPVATPRPPVTPGTPDTGRPSRPVPPVHGTGGPQSSIGPT